MPEANLHFPKAEVAHYVASWGRFRCAVMQCGQGDIKHWAFVEKVSIWQAGVHDKPLGQRLTALMISKGLADSCVPMSLLADYPNVQFNYYHLGGLGSCAVEMH